MPFVKGTLANRLTDTIRDVVRAEVINRSIASGQLYQEPRIFNDLPSPCVATHSANGRNPPRKHPQCGDCVVEHYRRGTR